SCINCYFSFFFQAEDGIRDFHVTGVQTCALPISGRSPSLAESSAFEHDRARVSTGHVETRGVRARVDPNAAPGPPETGPRLGKRSEERRVGKEGTAGGSWSAY